MKHILPLALILIVLLCAVGIYYMSPSLPPVPLPVGDSIEGNQTHGLDIGWNMISMPEKVNKENIFVTYNNNSYTWEQAVNNGYVADVIMSYNGEGYVEVETLYTTKGYWTYSLVSPLHISSTPSIIYCAGVTWDGTENITCNRIIIAPELYDNVISCSSMNVIDSWEFHYEGGIYGNEN